MRVSGILTKLSQLLRYVFASKKAWRWPKTSDVLIFDAAEQFVLPEYLGPWDPERLYCRGEAINVAVFLTSLFKKGKRFDAYVDTFVERVRPKLVVTFIDNNLSFYRLSARHEHVKTMFVQNGYRGFYQDVFEPLSKLPAPREELIVDYMLTFGTLIGEEYAKYVTGRVVQIGSIINNHVQRTCATDAGVIAFVSQYKKGGAVVGGETFSHDEFCRRPDAIIVGFLSRYAQERGKRLRIITRSRAASDFDEECAYFREIAGPAVTFVWNQDVSDAYRAVDAAEVVVVNTSTLGLESAARNKKTAFFTIHKHIYASRGADLVWDRGLSWPEVHADDGPFWTSRPDPVEFTRILDHLFAISDDEWQAELSACGFSRIITYDPGNSILQAILREELGAPPSSRSGE